MLTKRSLASLLALSCVATLTLTGCTAAADGGSPAEEGGRTVETVLGPVTVPEAIDSVIVGRPDAPSLARLSPSCLF